MNVKPTQIGLPFDFKGDAIASVVASERPVGSEQLMERVLSRDNLLEALKRVERNVAWSFYSENRMGIREKKNLFYPIIDFQIRYSIEFLFVIRDKNAVQR